MNYTKITSIILILTILASCSNVKHIDIAEMPILVKELENKDDYESIHFYFKDGMVLKVPSLENCRDNGITNDTLCVVPEFGPNVELNSLMLPVEIHNEVENFKKTLSITKYTNMDEVGKLDKNKVSIGDEMESPTGNIYYLEDIQKIELRYATMPTGTGCFKGLLGAAVSAGAAWLTAEMWDYERAEGEYMMDDPRFWSIMISIGAFGWGIQEFHKSASGKDWPKDVFIVNEYMEVHDEKDD